MALTRYSKKELEALGADDYKIIPCETEDKAIEIKATLKANKRLAQAGWVKNKEGKTIYFVCTRERRQNGKQK